MRFFDDQTAVAGAAQSVASAGTSVAGAILGVASAVLTAGRGLTTALSGLAMTSVAAVAVAAGALALSLRTATSAMTDFAKSAAQIRSQTGLSYGQSGDLINRAGAFGIGAKEAGGIFGAESMNPMLQSMRGMVAGVAKVTDPNYFLSLAQRYQEQAASGPFGRMLANQSLDMQFGGSAPDSIRNLVNMDQGKIAGQLQWQQGVQSSLGVTPDMIRRYAEDIPLLQNRIGSLWEMIKVRFAGELAPFFEKILGGVADYVSQNADKIADGIKTAAKWLMVEAPALVLGFVSRVLEVMGQFLKGAGAFLTGLSENASGILGVLDVILNGTREFASFLVGVGTAIWQGINDLITAFGPGGALAVTLGAVIGGAIVKAIAGGVAGAVATRVLGPAAGAAGAAGAARWVAPAAGAVGFGGAAAGLGVLASGVGVIAATTGIGIGAGVLAGAGAYKVGQSLGLIDREQGFGDRMATGWGRLRDIITRNPGNYDRMVNDGWARDEAARVADARGMAAAATDPMSAFRHREGRGLVGAFNEGRAGFKGLVPESNLAGKYGDSLSGLLARAGNAANSGGDSLIGMSASLDEKAKAWRGEMLKILDGIEKNTGQTAKGTDKSAENIALLRDATTARIASYIAEDSFLNLTRAS